MKINQKIHMSLLVLIASTNVFAQSTVEHQDGSKRMSSMYSENWDKTLGKWYANDSVTYKYNSKSNPTEALFQSYNTSTTIYNPREVEYYIYDSKGNAILHVDSFLLPGLLNYRIREVFLNNNQGQVLSNTTQNWDKTNSVWAYANRYFYTYTAGGLVQNYTIQSYDATNKIYNNYNKDSNIYTAQNQLLKKFTSYWDKANSKWVLNKRETHFYSGTNKETAVLQEAFILGQWVNVSKTESAYNADDKLKSYVAYNYNTSLLSWVYAGRYTYYYDNVAATKTNVVEDWNLSKTAWDTARKFIYQLNASGWETSYTEYSWDATYKVFKNFARISSTYNASGYITYDMYEIFDDFSKVWKNNGQYWYRYAEVTGTQNIQPQLEITAYPNPSSGAVFIALPEMVQNANISIFNSTGQLVLQQNVNDTKTAELTMPNKPGIYFVKVHTDRGGMGSTTIIRN